VPGSSARVGPTELRSSVPTTSRVGIDTRRRRGSTARGWLATSGRRRVGTRVRSAARRCRRWCP
jgi:hypothetical protein